MTNNIYIRHKITNKIEETFDVSKFSKIYLILFLAALDNNIDEEKYYVDKKEIEDE